MLHRSHTWAHFALILTVVLLSLSVVSAQDQPKPEAVGLRPDAPPYALHGPYWVGIIDESITFEYPDGMIRESRVTVWYPTEKPSDSTRPYTYPAEVRISAYGGPLFFPRHSEAYLKAAPVMGGAPYPLVIYSHAGWGYRWFQTEYVEHLASYGFVVIATDHEDQPPIGAMLPHFELSRQWDVARLIDYAEMLTGEGGTLAGLIDVDKVGVTGFSAGGFTAILAGGARISPQAKVDWCASEETKASWIWPLLCTDLEARGKVWSELLGWAEPVGDPWPAVGDPRIDALVSLDGGAHDFGPEGVSAITIPALLIFARGAPGAIPYAHDSLMPALQHDRQSIAIFEQADHALFVQPCLPGMMMKETMGACAQPVWDKARAADLYFHLATAFLLDVLKGDKDAHAALAPDAVSFPGIEYQAQGF